MDVQSILGHVWLEPPYQRLGFRYGSSDEVNVASYEHQLGLHMKENTTTPGDFTKFAKNIHPDIVVPFTTKPTQGLPIEVKVPWVSSHDLNNLTR